MRYKKYLLAAAALVLVAVTAVPASMAYFTDTESAQGGFEISLGEISHVPNESVDGMTKKISITNTGEYPVFVRVKAEKPDGIEIGFSSQTSSGWTLGDDGYYYYADAVAPGQATPTDGLQLEIKPTDDFTGDSFDVIILSECSRALYSDGTAKDASGNLIANGTAYADWTTTTTSQEVTE